MKLRCGESCTLISFSVWEEASAAGAGLVMSDFVALASHPAALAQVEIS